MNIMEESTKDRLYAFMKHLGISVAAFEKEIKVSNGYFRSLRHRPSEKVLQRIYDRYPEMNRMWLLGGEGEMINLSPKDKIDPETCGMMIEMQKAQISYLKMQIEIKDKQIEQLIQSINELKQWKK